MKFAVVRRIEVNISFFFHEPYIDTFQFVLLLSFCDNKVGKKGARSLSERVLEKASG